MAHPDAPTGTTNRQRVTSAHRMEQGADRGTEVLAPPSFLQVAPFRGTYRPGLMEFEITDDVVVGRGIALANPRYGPGGLEQFYIPHWEHVASPDVTRLMQNMIAR